MSNVKEKKARSETILFWQALITTIDKERAQKSLSELCQTHAIHESQYYYWKKRFSEEVKAPLKNGFEKVKIKPAINLPSRIILRLPTGWVFELPQDTRRETLRALFQSLGVV